MELSAKEAHQTHRGHRDAPPPPHEIAGPARRGLTPGPGAWPPRRDVCARRDHGRGPGHACTVAPPPYRWVRCRPLAPHNEYSWQNDAAPCRVSPVPRPPRHRPRTGSAVAGRNRVPAAACGLRSSGRAAGCRAAFPPPAHGEVPRERRLRAPGPRGAVPAPPEPGGHPLGVLPPLDGHGRPPQMRGVGPAARSKRLAVLGPFLHEALG